jgi:signal transduction histidine kinase
LDRLEERGGQLRATGLEVAVSVEGTPCALPPALDLSAYRVVQEALTNTLKHAEATRAEVTLSYGASELSLEVRDNGRASGNGDGTGSGLIGMRERMALFGGSLSAGPDPAGGFAVSARIPLGQRSE